MYAWLSSSRRSHLNVRVLRFERLLSAGGSACWCVTDRSVWLRYFRMLMRITFPRSSSRADGRRGLPHGQRHLEEPHWPACAVPITLRVTTTQPFRTAANAPAQAQLGGGSDGRCGIRGNGSSMFLSQVRRSAWMKRVRTCA
jgi:hypothetical protein